MEEPLEPPLDCGSGSGRGFGCASARASAAGSGIGMGMGMGTARTDAPSASRRTRRELMVIDLFASGVELEMGWRFCVFSSFYM